MHGMPWHGPTVLITIPKPTAAGLSCWTQTLASQRLMVSDAHNLSFPSCLAIRSQPFKQQHSLKDYQVGAKSRIVDHCCSSPAVVCSSGDADWGHM